MKIDELSEAIFSELSNYSEEVDKQMQDEIDKVSKEIKKSLSSNPNIPKKSGDYAKGFRIKKEAQGRGYKRNRIYNKKYQLTHLLEKGHAKINDGKTRAYPHWKDAQDLADKLPKKLKELLEK